MLSDDTDYLAPVVAVDFLAAQHVSPAVKHEFVPGDGPIIPRNLGAPEGFGVFTGPANDLV
jgi:hypothetical protein